MLIFIYVVLVFLVLRFSVTLFNFLSNPKMGNYGRHFNDLVSIIINTNGDTSELITSIEQQEYKNIEIISWNAGEYNVLKEAKGSYFLFLDANTVIKNGLINSLVYRTKVFNLALLSIIPTQQLMGFFEKCIYPLSDFVFLNLFPLRLVRLVDHPIFTAVNESCMFFDAAIYRQYEWHKQLKESAAVEVVKLIKQEQLKADLLLGNKLIFIRQELNALTLNLFVKRLMLTFNNYLLVAILYVILVVAGPIVLFLEFDPVFFVLPMGLIFLTRIMISFLSAQHPVRNILLHPLQMLSLIFLVFKAIGDRVFTHGRHKK